MANVKKSSFQKKGDVKSNIIKGTKPSLHNSQLLVSSGMPSFDALLGGGIPVGSIVLINEDEYGTYAKHVLKYFLGEGVASKHATFLCSLDCNPKQMIEKLPCLVSAEIEDETNVKEINEKMLIAWRYENLKTVSSSLSSYSYFGHYFDLSSSLDEKILKNSDIELWTESIGNCGESFSNTHYWALLKSIEEKLKRGKYFANQNIAERNILRIVLHSINSPLWHYDFEGQSSQNFIYFYKFLYMLRSIIRNTYSVCVLSVPFSNYNKSHIEKCIHFSDIAVQLQSFTGTKCENVVPYKDYHGFFIFQKIAAINSIVAFQPKVTNLAFKLRRRKFVIEEFHLPPELEDSAEREQDDSAVLTCSLSKSKNLDF